MKFNEIETVVLLQDVTIYWVALSDMPEAVQDRAKEIDAQEYDAQGFGACAGYDFAKNEFFFFTEEGSATRNGNIFYVDTDGDRHWFRVEIGDELTKQIFDACNRVNGGIDTPQGYNIQKTVQFDRGFGLVLAKKDDATHPFSAWMFEETEEGRRDYVWSHFFTDEKAAEKAFANAIDVQLGKKPSIRGKLAATKEALAEKPHTQLHQKDKEAR